MVVGCTDVVGPSASGYQFVPFVSSSKWVPFGVFRLHGPLVELLGRWLCKFLIPDIIDFATQLNTFLESILRNFYSYSAGITVLPPVIYQYEHNHTITFSSFAAARMPQ